MLALITGASSGIGKDMARVLAKKDYDIALVARNKVALNELKDELEKANSNIKVSVHSYDLSVKENCFKLHDEVKNVDILINNAGFGTFGNFTDIEIEKEISMIDTNISAVHILTKLYLQDMKDKKGTHIMNVASIAGFMPGPLMATYYATKNYVVALSRAVNRELRKSKAETQISVLCPGPVNTNFNAVAGVKFKLKGLTSEYVAKYAIENMLKGKLIILPGFFIKVVRCCCEIVPDCITEKVAYTMQKKKNTPSP